MDYIDKIKLLRQEKGITQVELSKELNLSPAAYGLYETRQRRMDIETLVAVCRYFNVSADSLLDIFPKIKK